MAVVTLVLGGGVIMLLALIGLLHTLDRFDRRRPGDLRGVAPVVPLPRPDGPVVSRRVVVMDQGADGVFRAS